MKEPSKVTIKRLFALSNNICGFPGCNLPIVEGSGTVTGEICHIEARSEKGPRFNPNQLEGKRHAFENLILLCRHHHKVIDDQAEIYTVEALHELKEIHENTAGRKELTEDAFFAQILLNDLKNITVSENSGNVAINSPGAIQANSVTIKATSKIPTINTPPGTLGHNPLLSRYIERLIKRYNEFASSEKTRKTKFSYGAISTNVRSKFGAKWQLINEDRFPEVSLYLQGRISKTRIAKINKSKGIKSFSTFEEYVRKYEKQ